MSYNAGTVFLQVVPSYDNFQRRLGRDAKKFGDALETELGKNLSIADVIDRQSGPTSKAAEKLGIEAGKRVGGRMHQQITASLDKAIKNLPKVVIDADTKKIDREIAVLRGRLEEIRDAHVKFDLDSGSAQAQIAQVLGEIEALHKTAERGSDLDIDTGGAMIALARVEALATAATRDRKMTVEVDTDVSRVDALMSKVRGLTGSGDDAANSFRAFNAVLLASIAIGPMLIPILAGLAAGLAALVPVAAAAGLGLGAVILGLSGIPSAVSAMNDVSKNAQKDALQTEKTMRGAANGIRDAEAALARARQDSARAQEDAARRIADAERGLQRAREDARRSAEDAARAVAAARRSLADAERQAADNIENALEREADARQRLRDVTERANRETAAAQRRLATATTAVTRAREDAARRNAEAATRIVRAENAVVEAQQSALRAQEALTDARKDAQDQLEDLAFQAEGGALAEREAVLALADAKKEYDRVMGREYKSARSVEEVTIALREAELSLERIRVENQRTAEELAEANAKGVEGSDQVVDAHQRLLDAQQQERDAIAAVAEAQREAEEIRVDGIERVNAALENQTLAQQTLRQAERDGAREIKDAQEAIAEAAENTGDVRAEAARDVADAERQVADAIRDQGQARVDSAQAIADAQRNVAEANLAAQRSGVDSAQAIADAQLRLRDAQIAYQDALVQTEQIGTSSAQKLQQEMAELSPAGQAFATFIFGLKEGFLELRRAAEEGLLPGLQDFLERVIGTYGPSFTRWMGTMAGVAGDLFRELGKVMTTSPVWREFFSAFGEASPELFREFGKATINWMTVFVALLDAFLPLAMSASDWLLKMSESAKDWASGLEDTKGFQDFMGWLERVLPKVGEFFGALWGALSNLLQAIAPFGEFLLEVFTGILDFIAGLPTGVLQALVGVFIALVLAIQGTLAIVSVAMTAFTVFATPFTVWVFVILAVIAAFVLLYANVEWFRDAVNIVLGVIKRIFVGVFNAIAEAAVWLWEEVLAPTWELMKDGWNALAGWFGRVWRENLKPVWDKVAEIATWLWENVLRPVFNKIGSNFETLAGFMGQVWTNILGPLFELVGTIVWAVWTNIFKVVFGFIKTNWEAMAWAMELVWRTILKPVFDLFMDAVGGKEGLQKAFELAVAGIKTIWNGLEAIAKKPIKFIIETVINDGLIGGFNKIAGFFGTKEMKPLALPQGWATGGYTGPGGRYEPAGIVHRDEYVISSPARQRFERDNPGYLDYINRTGRMPGYAVGGLVKPIKAPFGLGYGNTYRDGGYHSGQDFPAGIGTPVYAALPGIVASVARLFTSYGHHIVLRHPGGLETLYAHLSTIGVNPGQVVGRGQPIGGSGNTGNSSGPHLHFEVRPGGGYGNAVNPMSYLSGAAEAPDGGGFFPDWMSNPFSWLKDKVTGLVDKIPGSGRFGELVREVPLALLGMAKDGVTGLAKGILSGAGDAASGAWDFITSPFGGRGDVPDNGAAMYDNGGYLPPGLTTVLNATGKPEPVFTSGQWSAIERAGIGGGGGQAGLTVNGDLIAADPEEMAAKIRTSQSDAAAVADLRSIVGGL